LSDEATPQKFLSFLFYSVGDTRQSLLAFAQYLTQVPDDVEALANKAHIILRYHHALDALPVLQTVLKIDPNHDTCLSMLAEVFYLQGDFSKAPRNRTASA
jgi:cytochrome c-type biogenesis protein CcmH/NrfG